MNIYNFFDQIMQQRRFAGSERFTFDDEGNLIGVPRLVSTPTKANRANKQAVLHEQPADRLGSIADTVGVKWRVVPTAPNGDQPSMGDLTDVSLGYPNSLCECFHLAFNATRE